MSDELLISARYIIRTFAGKALGLTRIQPDIFPPPPRPIIEVPDGVQPEEFNIVKVGENAYDVAAAVDIGGRLFEFPEVTPQRWVIIFRPHQRAYTVEKQGTEDAWTAPKTGKSPQILVQPVKVISQLHPPQFPDDVLFRFERVVG